MNEGSSTWLFLIGMNLWYFMSGAEYGLILPTQNEYMLTLGAAPKVIGIAFTLFAFAGLVSSPFCGWATDRLGAIKLPLLTMITCSIVGSVIYTFTRSIPGIFLGRLVQGVGWGIDGAIIGRVALITEKSGNGSMMIGLCLLMRQAGIILGSLIGSNFVASWNFMFLGMFEIDKLNAPGLAVAFMWSFALAFSFIATVAEPQLESECDKITSQESLNLTNGKLESEEQPLQEKQHQKDSVEVNDFVKYIQVKKLPLMTEQIAVCTTCSFSAYILQSTLESIVTLLTKSLFGWGNEQNLMLFTMIGITAVVGYVIVMLIGKCFPLRTTLLIGVSLEGCLLIAMGTILPMAHFREQWIMYSFIAITGSFIILLPFVFVSSATLMSNFTEPSQKSTIQGLRVTAERLAQICGPMWGTGTFPNYALLFTFPAIFLFLSSFLIFLSWEWLDPSKIKNVPEKMLKEEK